MAGKPIATAQEAYGFLEGLIRTDTRPYPVRARLVQQTLRRLLARVGNPQYELRIIHIAGSKGKGSTALLAEAILLAAGKRVGTFTSPHLQRWTERFRVGGREIAGERLATLLERLRPHMESPRAEDADLAPGFFGTATAAALLLFQQENVDVAIVEAGLGGRLDATNIIVPAVACITTVELEHTDKLGNTLESIAWEKAGIIKPGVPVVMGHLPSEAARWVAARADRVGAPLILPSPQTPLPGGEGLLSPGLKEDAGLAVACVRQLGILSTAELEQAVRRGYRKVSLPGRVEVLSRRPWVVVDAAHTPDSAKNLADALSRLPARRSHMVLSVSTGKDLEAICARLLGAIETVTVTRAEAVRSLPPNEIAARIHGWYPGIELRVEQDPARAVREAVQGLDADDLLCITGSVYMAGIGRAAWRDSNA